MAPQPHVLVKEIKVGKRYRKDLGDLVPLIKSIADVGLLHPVVITPDKRLIAGERRLAAVKELGWKEIPVHIADNILDALKFLRAERDENTCRKDFAPSEAVALGSALEDLEKPAAQKRKTSGANQYSQPSSKLDEGSSGRTDEKVASAVGMGKDTYRKAKAIVEAAKEDPTLAPLVEEMDRTGKVDGVFKKIQEEKPKALTPEQQRWNQYPHSERIDRLLDEVVGETEVIRIELGGIKAMLAEKEKWDWQRVREYTLHQLELLEETLHDYRKEIESYAIKQGRR